MITLDFAVILRFVDDKAIDQKPIEESKERLRGCLQKKANLVNQARPKINLLLEVTRSRRHSMCRKQILQTDWDRS